jgi:hypothetical protein
MTGEVASWLLLLLRYAVTREPSDRSAALAMADELDSLGGTMETDRTEVFSQDH